MITVLPSACKHYSGHRKATEEEEDLIISAKKISRKDLNTAERR